MAAHQQPRKPEQPRDADCRTTAGADTPLWQAALALAETIPPFARPSAAELATLTRACAEPRHLHLLLEAFARHASTLTPLKSATQPAPEQSQSDSGTTFADDATQADANAADGQKDTNGTAYAAQPKSANLCQLNDADTSASTTNGQTISGQPPYALLCDFVDNSSHDLREWINALAVFEDWLCQNNRPPQPLTMLLPYLACSAEAQANSPMPLPLPHILADMLELYGYDGEQAISTEP